MKNVILGLVLTIGSFAQANVGTLTGFCQVGTPENEFHFSVKPDEKAVLGFNGFDNGLYRVTITNNTGVAEKIALTGWAASMGLRRDNPYFKNPPTLCERGKTCEQEPDTHVPAATDDFHSIANDGFLDVELVPMKGAALRESELQDGAKITLNDRMGYVFVHCEATLNK